MWGHYQQRNALPNHGFRENAHNDELYRDLRYQGQIEDRESGLYYNVIRYYDADSGQYLSPAPIGFAGGLRPQAYVFNPLDWVDPLGLAGCPERDERVRHIAEKHGGKKLDDGGYKMPNKRAAKNAASEIAGDLGSDASKVRRKDYTDISNTHKQNRSERVIGKISSDKSSAIMIIALDTILIEDHILMFGASDLEQLRKTIFIYITNFKRQL